MIEITDILIQLAFELGQAYERIYMNAGLDNVIDFNDIAFANSCGAQWSLKGDMSNLPELFRVHQLNEDKINALNDIAKDLQKVKLMAKDKVKE